MINLLPHDIRLQRSYGRKNRVLVGYSIAILITAALVGGIMIGGIQFVGRDASAIEQDIAANETLILSLERDIKDLKDVSTRLSTADKLYDHSITFSELIPKIGSILPRGTIINGLSLTGGIHDPLSLSVSMTSPDLAPVLQRNLVESELFEAADIGSITPTGSDGAYTYTASVDVSFTGSAEAKRKEKAAAAAAAAAQAEANAAKGDAQ